MMVGISDPIVILSPALPQSFAIADLLQRHDPDLRLLGCPLGVEKGGRRPPFARYIKAEEAETACLNGTAIITGSAATEHVLSRREKVKLGQVIFERRNLWFFDKIAVLSRARQLDIPVPATWTSVDEIMEHRGSIFYKPAREGTAGPRKKCRSIHAVPPLARCGGYVFQEVIEGTSVIGFGFLADRGKVVTSRLHRETRSYPPEGGSAIVVEHYDSPRADELAKRLISDFQYSGWGLVEFKPCSRRNDFVLMELNAKFWASLEFTLRTHPLFSYLLFGAETEAEPIRRMVWPSRLLRNGLIHLPASLRAALPATPSREQLSWRDWARSLFP